jgi:DNA-binding MarR family transcriptional regulator
METATPEDAWTRFAMSIFKLNGLIIRAGEGIAQPIGQSSARWQVLGRAFKPRTVADMARDIGHARQAVQRIADALAAEGLIAYTEHPTDRRTKLVALTPQGMEVLTAIYLRQVEWSQRLLTKLDPDRLVAVADALEGIGEIVETEVNQE